MLYLRIGAASHQSYIPRRKQPHSMKCGLYAGQSKPDLKQRKMWDQKRNNLLPWPRERENLANLVHKEQTTKTCPKSNAMDAKNMDITKGFVLTLRGMTTTKERGKKLTRLKR